MANRASPTAIGAFVVGALALVVLGLVAFGSLEWWRRPLRYVMYFDRSVTGLSVGSPVEFRGVKVGEVKSVAARWGSDWISVYVDLDTSGFQGTRRVEQDTIRAGIERGLRAQLRMQSLITGQLLVALDFFPDTPIKLVGIDRAVPEIPTVPTQLQVVSERLERLFKQLESVPLDKLVNATVETVDQLRTLTSSPELRATLRASHRLVVNADRLVQRADREATPLLTSLRETSDGARRLLARVETEVTGLNELVKDTRHAVQTVRGEVGPLAASVRTAADSARLTLDKARATLISVDRTVEEDSRLGYQLARTLQELQRASRSLRTLADFLDRHPESLLVGKRRPGDE